MRKIILLFLLFQFLFFPCFGQVVINEIMYNPSGDDTKHEWIEIYNKGSTEVNITGWKFYEDDTNHKLNLTQGSWIISARGYAVIADDADQFLLDYSDYNGTLFDSSFSLHNTGETIAIKEGSSGPIVDSVTYNESNGWKEAKDGNSLQRINPSQNLSNNSTNWIAFPPSPGKRNFYNTTYFEILDISFPKQNFVNNIIKFNLTILNRGIKNGTRNVSFTINTSSTIYSNTTQVYMNETSLKTILFNWTPNLTGNYTICSEANNSLCKKFVVLPLQNASISLNIAKENKKIIFYTNISNASCTIDYNISISDFIIDSGRIEKESFKNATLDIGFGKFKVCANMTVHNFNDINSSDNLICKNITITPENKRYRIRVWIDKEKYELNDTIKWIVQLFLPENKNNSGNLTLKLGKNRKSGSGFNYFDTLYENNSFNISENGTTIFGNFTIPENYIEGIYKIRAKFKYGLDYLDSSDNGIFWLNGLKDLGELNFSLIGKIPEEAKFGEFLSIPLIINSNNENGEIKLKAGINKYLNEDKTKYPYISLPISLNLERGKTYYLVLPLLIDPNCNNKYKNGKYRAVLYIDKKPYELFNLSISGKTGNLCQYISRSSSRTKFEEQLEILEIEILNKTKEAARNQEFTTAIKLKNKANKKITFEIYSYAYNGKECITGSWTANKEKVSLNKGEERIINLTNKIKKDAKPGEYIFRIRAKINHKTFDLTDKIRVIKEIVENKTEERTIIAKENPELKIWNDTKLRINLSNCSNCRMIIVGPNTTIITNRKYRVFEDFGKYEIFVIKDKLILNRTYIWSKEQNFSNKLEESNKITGNFMEVKQKNLFNNFVSSLKNFISSLINLMEKSIK